jgi:AcrR family transcriptional regulator
MSDVKVDKRPYRSPLRQEQAEATRQRILDAGLDLFASRGYPGTSVAEIARAAGVSVETIYASVGSKRGIIDALLGQIDVEAVAARARRDAAANDGDPRAAIAIVARIAADFWREHGKLVTVLRNGLGDPEIGDAWLERQTDRRQRMFEVVDGWPPSALRPGMTRDRAIDIMWTLTSPDVYILLVDMRGWSDAAYVDWVRDTLIRELLAD